jgi:hypothetical protein
MVACEVEEAGLEASRPEIQWESRGKNSPPSWSRRSQPSNCLSAPSSYHSTALAVPLCTPPDTSRAVWTAMGIYARQTTASKSIPASPHFRLINTFYSNSPPSLDDVSVAHECGSIILLTFPVLQCCSAYDSAATAYDLPAEYSHYKTNRPPGRSRRSRRSAGPTRPAN